MFGSSSENDVLMPVSVSEFCHWYQVEDQILHTEEKMIIAIKKQILRGKRNIVISTEFVTSTYVYRHASRASSANGCKDGMFQERSPSKPPTSSAFIAGKTIW
jgi:hypothetical protein